LFAFSILHREELLAGSTCQQHALHSYTIPKCARQVNGKGISFLNDARPSKRAVNLHASWAHKQAASLSKQAPASGVVTLNEINELPESVWSQSSWKEYVEEWLANDS
jgi:hypothetical protein